MTAIVLLAFAAHVVAWLILPERKAAKAVREAMRASHAMQPSSI